LKKITSREEFLDGLKADMLLNMAYLSIIKPLNAELNPICHLLELLGSHHILHVSRVWVKGELL